MQIWVDADACPVVVKDILFRAAERAKITVILVANQAMRIPASHYIQSVQVGAGFDVADNYIVQKVVPGDLLITADIPLAAEAIEKGARVISPRGEELTTENIKPRLTMRNFLEEMRSTGQVTGGPAPLSKKDRQVFANALDRLLAKR
ncbi:MAG: YaiI/YqxD family protein [Pseudomonadales bacterium]|nr:YaiI/YqxD family protein [Pseudomonadales bacterium]